MKKIKQPKSSGDNSKEISPEILSKLKQANFVNIVRKIKSGKTLSSAEQRQLEQASEPSSRVAGNMSAAISLSGLTKDVLNWAKKKGCPAFRNSRIYVDELPDWIKANEDSKVASKLSDRDILENDIKREMLDEKRFKNALKRNEYILFSEVEKWLTLKAESVKQILTLKLKNDLPPKLHGMTPDQMCAAVDPLILEIIIEMRKPLPK